MTKLYTEHRTTSMALYLLFIGRKGDLMCGLVGAVAHKEAGRSGSAVMKGQHPVPCPHGTAQHPRDPPGPASYRAALPTRADDGDENDNDNQEGREQNATSRNVDRPQMPPHYGDGRQQSLRANSSGSLLYDGLEPKDWRGHPN